jgi:hypothetical protein
VHPAQHGVLGDEARGPGEGVLVAEADLLEMPAIWTSGKVNGFVVAVFDQE